ncbi:MAG: LON peptidase substrate-binding domain-containing protein [Acidobacteria bacterium]|nr:LON peptidase substrate-binding domain-containing protein [Acidobacteriota bacterium]
MTGDVVDFPDIVEIPIFPLPNVVLFPRTLLPLHIFEPRYKQMVGDALEGSRQLGMVLLQPGWESGYRGNPEVFDTGGMGVITEYKSLDEGQFNILLSGRQRFRIMDFIQQEPYRIARVRWLKEVIPRGLEANELATKLALSFDELGVEGVSPEINRDLLEKLDFPTLVNSICSSLSLSVYDKQQLLEMNNLKTRAKTILAVLKQQVSLGRFVSQFSHLKPEDPSVN